MSSSLLITDRAGLIDEMRRLAAACGAELVWSSPADARSRWRAATTVIVDARCVDDITALALPRRAGVVVVAVEPLDAQCWERCLQLGVARTLQWPDDAAVLELLGDLDSSGGDGRVIAVIGARGGAGASTLAAAVAVAGVRSGGEVLLMDCDPFGPGQDLVVGAEAATGLRWLDLPADPGRISAGALHDVLPRFRVSVGERRTRRSARGNGRAGEVAVLAHSAPTGSAGSTGLDVAGPGASGGGSSATVPAVLDSCRRSGWLAVVDLPRSTDPVSEAVLAGSDLVVLLATADVPCCASAARMAGRLRGTGARLGLVVRGPAPGGLSAADISETLELPLLASMRAQPRIAADLEWGRVPGIESRSPLGRAATRVVTALGELRR